MADDDDDCRTRQDGDESAMDPLVRKEWLLRDEVRTELLSIARGTGLGDEAEDVYHEFCLDKLDAVAKAYDPARRDLALAAKAFRNYCLTRLTSRAREKRRFPAEELTAADDLRSDLASALQALEESDVRQAVDRAVRRLDPGAQEIITFFYWDGRSCEEIAFLVGKSRAAVKVAMHRARKDVRAFLQDEANALSQTDVTDWPHFAARIAGLASSGETAQPLWNLLPDRARGLAMTEATSSIPNVAARREILAELNSLLRRPDLWLTAGLDGLLTSQLGDAVRKLRKSPELTISVNRQRGCPSGC